MVEVDERAAVGGARDSGSGGCDGETAGIIWEGEDGAAGDGRKREHG